MILRCDSYLVSRYDPFQTASPLSIKKTLKKGYYYMEVIARDMATMNFYYVNVGIPPISLQTDITNPTWLIQNIKISPKNTLP